MQTPPVAPMRKKLVTFIKRYFLFSLRSTIISLFLPVIIFFIAFTGWISYQLAVTQLEENAYKSVDDTVFQTKAYLENRLYDIFEQLVAFSNNPKTLDIIDSESSDINAQDYIEMNNLLRSIHLNFDSIIDSILVDMHNGEFTLYQSDYRMRFNHFPYKEYAEVYKGNKEGFYWHNEHPDDIFASKADVVSVFKLIGTDSSKVNGVLLFNLRRDFFENVFNKSLIGEHGFLTLVSPEGTFNSKAVAEQYRLSSKEIKYLQTLQEEKGKYEFKNADGKNMTIIFDTIGVNKWKVAAVFPTDEILKKANYIKYVTLIVILVLTAVAVLIANFFSKYITNPVSALVSQTKQINEDNLNLSFNHNGPREIEILNTALEDLMVRINTLLEQIRLEQDQKRQLEFSVLHAQINPHFLYNTLYSIKGLADMGMNKEASSMITALSNFFRISISRGKEIINLEEELAHIENYLIIQEMRYGDDFSYVINMDSTLLNYKIVKLTLQPLIENAIYHGVKQKRGKGEIVVNGYVENGNICIEVIDNGSGMNRHNLNEIREELANKRSNSSIIGIGLRSVHERIKMHFGDEYGLTIESEEGTGTRSKVMIPMTKGGVNESA
ncbi:sensor histidine kinase [Neobacillus cucumis]|uniref:sensor histidine kinase n=1 Tax=Neobacillus cucumis TaxID=1740721 RepID=UPI002041E6B6|nr:sensor histidine kinase [Neobacillus cucumis]MCM3728055.1 sensor histidine kinase [Neobacillus cucumis]